ncbi:MAG: polysaccharide biosynthesis C-terminal domain-containing protein [Bacteroidales bacterium]|nr:polysaccharide biosynthesis C-terminal domain-containing protein [Bacteroidales bacterium]
MAKRSYFQDIASVFGTNVFTLASNLLLVVVLVRLLGPANYGLYTSVLVVPMLVVSFFQMGIRATTVHLIGSGKYDDNSIVSSVLTILLLTSFAGILFSGLAYFFVNTAGYTRLLMGMALIVIPLRLTAVYAGGVFLGKEEIPSSNLMNWLAGLLMLIFAMIFVLALKLGLNGALLSMLLSNLIVAIVALVKLFRQFTIRISFANPLIGKLLQTGVVYALSFLVIQLNYRIDILLLKALSTPVEVGIYSLGVSVAELLWQVPLAISVVVMSRSANATDQTAINQSTARLLRISMVFGLIISTFIVLLAPWVVPLVFGEKFRDSILVMQTILPGILMVIFFRILSGQLSGMGRPEVALKAFIPALILNVILNYIWIPGYGANGAVMATNISYTLGSVIYLFAYSRISGMRVREILRFSMEDWSFIARIKERFSGAIHRKND